MTVDVRVIAAEILAARRNQQRLEPFTNRFRDFDVAAAYRASAQLRRVREQAGERVVGRKIGFTNRSIWPEYGVYGPIWGEVYDSTLIEIESSAEIAISRLSQPRLEPEIVLGIDDELRPGMSIHALERAIGWVAHGFEIVQTVFQDWKFAAADCVAEGSLHGLLLIGPRKRLEPGERAGLSNALLKLRVTLLRNGTTIDQGSAENVLDGPLHALKFMVDGVAEEPSSSQLKPGEVVTTGTMTRAFPIAPGERWTTHVDGFDLPGLDVTFE